MTRKIVSPDLLFFILTLILSTCFGLYLSFEQVTDPFLYYDIAFIKSLQDASQMIVPKSGPFASLQYVPGREMLMLQFVNMMGITPETLQFLPLGTIFISLSLYLLSLRVLKSPLMACSITLYLTLNLSHAAALYSTFAYAFGLPIFFAVLTLSPRLFNRLGARDVMLSLLLFIGAHLIHYTVASWIITFLVGSNIAIWLYQVLKPVNFSVLTTRTTPAYHLSLAFIIIYFFFNETLYKSFLPLIGLETLDGAVQRFLIYLSIEQPLSRSLYLFTRPTEVSLISVLSLLIILIPILVGVLVQLWQLIRQRSLLNDVQRPMMWGILAMGIIDAVAYSIRGSISTKSFSMIFPIITLLYVQRSGKRTLYYGMAILLLSLSVLKAGIFLNHSYVITSDNDRLAYSNIEPSAKWLQDSTSKPQLTLLADMNLYGKYLVASVEEESQPILQGYTDSLFENTLHGANEWGNKIDYLVIDLVSQEPVIGFVWALYSPLNGYLNEIAGNSTLHIVYDDGSVWFTKPIEDN